MGKTIYENTRPNKNIGTIIKSMKIPVSVLINTALVDATIITLYIEKLTQMPG